MKSKINFFYRLNVQLGLVALAVFLTAVFLYIFGDNNPSTFLQPTKAPEANPLGEEPNEADNAERQKEATNLLFSTVIFACDGLEPVVNKCLETYVGLSQQLGLDPNDITYFTNRMDPQRRTDMAKYLGIEWFSADTDFVWFKERVIRIALLNYGADNLYRLVLFWRQMKIDEYDMRVKAYLQSAVRLNISPKDVAPFYECLTEFEKENIRQVLKLPDDEIMKLKFTEILERVMLPDPEQKTIKRDPNRMRI